MNIILDEKYTRFKNKDKFSTDNLVVNQPPVHDKHVTKRKHINDSFISKTNTDFI